MNYNKYVINEGVTFHKINTSKFKTNLFAIFLTTPLTRLNVTKNALISAVLRRGTNNIQTQDLISKELENMYGASFNCGVEKNGDNQILKFYIESINDEFLPDSDCESLAKKSLNLLLDIVFNPLVVNEGFKKEYVDNEKNTLKTLIEGKIDNKARYALERAIEEMFKDDVYGLFKYGYLEDFDDIDEKILYEYYKELIASCKIDVFVSGDNIDNLHENEILKNLNKRMANYIPTNVRLIDDNSGKLEKVDFREIKENMDLNQGKLIIGMDILNMNEDESYATSLYNVILGGGANSKLFQNVRERASLAYNAGSTYFKPKSTIFIKCGIEPSNYDKAIDIIKEQIQQMKNGDFSEDDILSAKKLILASVNGISDSQDGEISYCSGQELRGSFVSPEDYALRIDKINKDEIVDIANRVRFNTVYFLY